MDMGQRGCVSEEALQNQCKKIKGIALQLCIRYATACTKPRIQGYIHK